MKVPTRYDACFERLRAAREGLFVPFVMLGDPDLETSARILDALVEGGADALELGIPFSDPIADGPTVQAAAIRARSAGVRPGSALALLAGFRARHPDVPVGLLTYANLVVGRGIEDFYGRCARLGIDSVLVADVPTREAEPFSKAAAAAGVAPVLIAPRNLTGEDARLLGRYGAAYTYCVTRKGVTGADQEIDLDHRRLFALLDEVDAPPPLLGFGIAEPGHVRAALDAGAWGAISGSAVLRRIEAHLDDPDALLDALRRFVFEMKAATEPPAD